jgi:hypothetical protein
MIGGQGMGHRHVVGADGLASRLTKHGGCLPSLHATAPQLKELMKKGKAG